MNTARNIRLSILSTLAAAALSAGCSSPLAVQDTEAFARLYYGQPRAITNLVLTGCSKITLEGTNLTLAVAQPVDPISLIPRDPGIAVPLIQAAERALEFCAGGYFLERIINGNLSARPAVVDRQVVEPTIVHTTP